MSQNLSLEDVLRYFPRAFVVNFVVRQVQLRNCFVQHQILYQNLSQVIVDQVPRQAQVRERSCRPQALRKILGVRHFHPKHRSFVLHTHMFGAVGQLQESQVWKIVEEVGNFKVLQLGNLK